MSRRPNQPLFQIPPQAQSPHRTGSYVFHAVLWLLLMCVYCVLAAAGVSVVYIAGKAIWFAVKLVAQAVGL